MVVSIICNLSTLEGEAQEIEAGDQKFKVSLNSVELEASLI